jgi:hypothetical protein
MKLRANNYLIAVFILAAVSWALTAAVFATKHLVNRTPEELAVVQPASAKPSILSRTSGCLKQRGDENL